MLYFQNHLTNGFQTWILWWTQMYQLFYLETCNKVTEGHYVLCAIFPKVFHLWLSNLDPEWNLILSTSGDHNLDNKVTFKLGHMVILEGIVDVSTFHDYNLNNKVTGGHYELKLTLCNTSKSSWPIAFNLGCMVTNVLVPMIDSVRFLKSCKNGYLKIVFPW